MAVSRVHAGAECLEVEQEVPRHVGAVHDRADAGRAGRRANLLDRQHARRRRGDVAEEDGLRARPEGSSELALEPLVLLEDGVRAGAVAAVVEERDTRVEQEVQTGTVSDR